MNFLKVLLDQQKLDFSKFWYTKHFGINIFVENLFFILFFFNNFLDKLEVSILLTMVSLINNELIIGVLDFLDSF